MDTVVRRLAHKPFGWHPTVLEVTVRRYRCSSRGHGYIEIANLNHDVTQPDGDRLTDPDLIRPGWVLELPAEQASAEPTPSAASATPGPLKSPVIPSPVASQQAAPPPGVMRLARYTEPTNDQQEPVADLKARTDEVRPVSTWLLGRSVNVTAEIYRHPIAPARSGHMVAMNQLIDTPRWRGSDG